MKANLNVFIIILFGVQVLGPQAFALPSLNANRDLICHDNQGRLLATLSGPNPEGARKVRFLGRMSFYGLRSLEICGDDRARTSDYGYPKRVLNCFDKPFHPHLKIEVILDSSFQKKRGHIEISNPRRLEVMAIGVCRESV